MQRLAVVSAVIVFLALAAAPALGQGACTIQNLAGTYVFESKGSSALASGPAAPPLSNHLLTTYAPIVVIGRMTIAPDGAVDGFYWAVFGTANAGLDRVAWQGQISDFADCRGVITYAVPVAGMPGVLADVTEHFVVVDGGQELRTVMKSFAIQGPSTQLPATWNTTARRVSNGKCGQPMLRGEWAMTCQSLHPTGGSTYAAEAVLITLDVAADGTFTGSFDSKIGPVAVYAPIEGRLTIGDACTATGEMWPAPAPASVITAKAVIFSEGKEFLAIPVQSTDGTRTWLNAFDNCRGIRVGR